VSPRFERLPNFITEEEKFELIKWIDSNVDNDEYFSDSRYTKRRTTRFVKTKVPFPQVAFDIQQRIIGTFEWTDKCSVELIGQGTGMIAIKIFPGDEGTFEHMDPKLLGRSSTRFNIVLQKPVGGELLVEGISRGCDERELHAYNVTETNHEMSPMEGDIPRYLWIFGMHVPHKEWEDGTIRIKED